MMKIFKRKYSSIQMINELLRIQMFGQKVSQKNINEQNKNEEHRKNIEHKFENINLPEIKCNKIGEHFKKIVTSQVEDYLKIIHEFKSIPQIPEKFCFKPGWTKYVIIKKLI